MNEIEYNSKEFFDANEQLAEIIKHSKEIVDIIESPQYPAHRGLADYIILLLQALSVEEYFIKKVENTFNSEFERRDKENENKAD